MYCNNDVWVIDMRWKDKTIRYPTLYNVGGIAPFTMYPGKYNRKMLNFLTVGLI